MLFRSVLEKLIFQDIKRINFDFNEGISQDTYNYLKTLADIKWSSKVYLNNIIVSYKISNENIDTLLSALKKNFFLNTLSLVKVNNFNIDFIKQILINLRFNKQLKNLILCGNNLTDEIIPLIVNLIKLNPGIIKIDLSNNKLTNNGISNLMTCKSILTRINLEHNHNEQTNKKLLDFCNELSFNYHHKMNCIAKQPIRQRNDC